MNQELKQIILDTCKNYPVEDHGVALAITGRRFRITLTYSGMVGAKLEIIAQLQTVYRVYFDIDGNTTLDKDVTEIYRAMQTKLHEQVRKKMATDKTSLMAIEKLRSAMQYDEQINKGR